ncbi:MAG: alkaline phosphatase family protein [Rhodomicrobium sp.]
MPFRSLKLTPLAAVAALALPFLGSAAYGQSSGANTTSASPIKHVIVVIGENRSFDHVFATYKPQKGQTVSNLLSKNIIKEDGTRGAMFSLSRQYTVAASSSYFVGSPIGKTLYETLPPPQLLGTPNVPTSLYTFSSANPFPPYTQGLIDYIQSQIPIPLEPGIPASDQYLLTTGATGLGSTTGVDTRVTKANDLPNGVYQLTGPTMPYDAYTADPTHRFYQMWQQSDCSTRTATLDNPSGCLHDLLPYVVDTYNTTPEGSVSMAFLNVQQGDAPVLKSLADQYTMSDNYHQAQMGGTMDEHFFIAMADNPYYSDGQGNPATPPSSLIANPNPQTGTNNRYVSDTVYTNCSDPKQPGVQPIVSLLNSLHYKPKPNCEAGHYYVFNNVCPAYNLDGSAKTTCSSLDGQGVLPPVSTRSIGDALNEQNISFAYYGGGYYLALADPALFSEIYDPVSNPFRFQKSIMTNPALISPQSPSRALKDVIDLYSDIANNTLPAVSYVKPDTLTDGHPQTSKLDLYEAFVAQLVGAVKANSQVYNDTAIFVTFDEGGGYYDSGFIQPLDFFGDGPRIPFIVVSPWTTGGRIVHNYADHASVVKFIERNWGLKPLTARSRDNFPNPVSSPANPYVPMNSPAIDDLYSMFNFPKKG